MAQGSETDTRAHDGYWDAKAARYDHDTEAAIGSDILDLMAARLAKEGPLGDVVEFGCGTGDFTISYAADATSVLATDISEPMLEIARTRLSGLDHVRVAYADAQAPGLPGGSFDTMVAMNLIHVVPDARKVMRETATLLRPGGRAIVSSVSMIGVPLLAYVRTAVCALLRFGPGLIRRRHDPDVTEMADLALQAGLEVSSCETLRGRRANALFLVARKADGGT